MEAGSIDINDKLKITAPRVTLKITALHGIHFFHCYVVTMYPVRFNLFILDALNFPVKANLKAVFYGFHGNIVCLLNLENNDICQHSIKTRFNRWLNCVLKRRTCSVHNRNLYATKYMLMKVVHFQLTA